MNVAQFVGRSEFVTAEGLAAGRYADLLGDLLGAVPPKKFLAPATEDLLLQADMAVRDLLLALLEAGARAPEMGYELTGAGGEIVAMAELGWEKQRVAVLLPREEPFRAAFDGAGWVVFLAGETDTNPEAVLEALGGGKRAEERE